MVSRLNEVLLFPDNCSVFKKTFLTHFHHHDTQHLLQAMSIPDAIEISAILLVNDNKLIDIFLIESKLAATKYFTIQRVLYSSTHGSIFGQLNKLLGYH